MADFALWATACESAFQRAGAFEAAYSNNRRDAMENIVDADPVAGSCVRDHGRPSQWMGSACDLLQTGTPTSLAGQRAAAHSLAGCAGHRSPFAPRIEI
jgi:hypothetical protein